MGWIQTISNLWNGRPRQVGGEWFYPIKGSNPRQLDYIEAFTQLSEVNAVLNIRARAFSSGKIKIVDKEGKELRAHRYRKLLSEPNWYQPQVEFLRQSKLNHDIFGNEYIFMLKSVGFDEVKGLFTLPPDTVTCEFVDPSPFFYHVSIPKVKYEVNVNSTKIALRHEDVLHLNDNRIVMRSDQKDILLGESKLQSLAHPINNLYAAYRSRGIIMHRRGALGVLSSNMQDVSGTIPLLDGEKNEIQDQYKKMYGSGLDQHQIIIASMPLKWQAIELDPRKLGLYEECEEDLNRILDTFSVPAELVIRKVGATYENQREARKGFFENVTIPEANEWIGALNSVMFQDDAAKAIMDYSHLPIFQEDIKAKNEATAAQVNYLSRLYADGAITHDEYREELQRAGIGNGKPLSASDRAPKQTNASKNGVNGHAYA